MKLEEIVGTRKKQKLSVLDQLHPQSEQWRRIFLLQLRNFGSIAAAAQATGISSTEVRRVQTEDTDFAESLREAYLDIGEILEAEVFRRALNGSDLLLMFATKRYNPAYKEAAQPTTNNVTVVKTYVGFNPDMWDQVKSQSSVKIIDGEVSMLPVKEEGMPELENVSRETLVEERKDEQSIES